MEDEGVSGKLRRLCQDNFAAYLNSVDSLCHMHSHIIGAYCRYFMHNLIDVHSCAVYFILYIQEGFMAKESKCDRLRQFGALNFDLKVCALYGFGR